MFDVATRVWNFRMRLAARILPGTHKHWEAYSDPRQCETCSRRARNRSLAERLVRGL